MDRTHMPVIEIGAEGLAAAWAVTSELLLVKSEALYARSQRYP